MEDDAYQFYAPSQTQTHQYGSRPFSFKALDHTIPSPPATQNLLSPVLIENVENSYESEEFYQHTSEVVTHSESPEIPWNNIITKDATSNILHRNISRDDSRITELESDLVHNTSSTNGYASQKNAMLFQQKVQGTPNNWNLDKQKLHNDFLPSSQKENHSHYNTPKPLSVEVNRPYGIGKSMQLRSVRELPELYRKVFPFPYFNVVQSKVLDDVIYTDKPVVVCAPTGSGKTALFELAIVRMLIKSECTSDFSYKVVYMAPMKALCSERLSDWTQKFGAYGLKCTELTGDSDLDDFQELQSTNIVLTTPEKWDSMTRRWRDYKSLVHLIRLFLIDEAHVIADESRGATMEAVVSRMKTVQKSMRDTKENTPGTNASIRFIAVSATIPNVEDISAWLKSKSEEAACYSLGEEYRPVQLRKVVLGYNCPENQSDFRFDLSLNYKLGGIIHTYSDCKPTIVFCSTRKGTSQAAGTLVKEARFILGQQHKQKLTRCANMLRDSKLREIVIYGVGYHHAGMDTNDRRAIEGMFAKGELPVLFCTSTLAMGVNLPAHLVIIKSTMHYAMGMYEEYPESQILQMIGRAGRPQFDTDATAVIMTKNSTKDKYQALVAGTQLMESSLHGNLTEHINAETVLGTITSTSVALEWLRSTFLYQRMQKNPSYYGVCAGKDKESIDRKLKAICLGAIHSLQSLDLIEAHSDNTVKPTETGKLMARYCIAFATMKLFLSLNGKESLEDLIFLLSKSKEFEDITLRNNEKRVLNSLNKDKHRPTIRFPMKSRVKTKDQKINCLTQATLGCLPITEFSLSQDVTKIFRAAQRVTRCLMEFCLLKGYFDASLNATILCKCVKARLWENSKFVSKQIEKIGPAMSSALVNAGMTTFGKIEEANPRELELIVNRNPPFGNQIQDLISALPKFTMQIAQDGVKPNKATVFLRVFMSNFEKRKEYIRLKKQPFQHCSCLLVADSAGNLILRQKLLDLMFFSSGYWERTITVHKIPKAKDVFFHLISLEYVGLDVEYTFTPEFQESSWQSNHLQQHPTDFYEKERDKKGAPRRPTCGHRCANKAWCGHECCKRTVEAGEEIKHEAKKASNTSKTKPSRKMKGQGDITESQTARRKAFEYFCDQTHERTNTIIKTPAKRMKIDMTVSTDNSPSSMQQKIKLSLEDDYGYRPRKLNFALKTSKTDEEEKILQELSTPITKLCHVEDFCRLRGEGMLTRDNGTLPSEDPVDIFDDNFDLEESYDFDSHNNIGSKSRQSKKLPVCDSVSKDYIASSHRVKDSSKNSNSHAGFKNRFKGSATNCYGLNQCNSKYAEQDSGSTELLDSDTEWDPLINELVEEECEKYSCSKISPIASIQKTDPILILSDSELQSSDEWDISELDSITLDSIIKNSKKENGTVSRASYASHTSETLSPQLQSDTRGVLGIDILRQPIEPGLDKSWNSEHMFTSHSSSAKQIKSASFTDTLFPLEQRRESTLPRKRNVNIGYQRSHLSFKNASPINPLHQPRSSYHSDNVTMSEGLAPYRSILHIKNLAEKVEKRDQYSELRISQEKELRTLPNPSDQKRTIYNGQPFSETVQTRNIDADLNRKMAGRPLDCQVLPIREERSHRMDCFDKDGSDEGDGTDPFELELFY